MADLIAKNILKLQRNAAILARTLTTQKHEGVRIIPTKYGQVAGKEVVSAKTNLPYVSFKGIPYGESTTGDLRFADPVPKAPWTGVKECFTEGNTCPQLGVKGDEDCLYMNVYTPKELVKGKLPVMVWIHGGAFIKGCSDEDVFGPDYFLRENVILVSFNYRLGPLGYMNTEDGAIAPNIALKDQLLAMKWVKDNIAEFGGDPENITLFGQSAGACNSTAHMVNKETKGLYHKVILQSGTALLPWSVNWHEGTARRRAFKLGSLLGIETNDSKELAKYLRKVPANAIVNMQYKTMTKADMAAGILFPFYPCVEPDKPTWKELFERGEINQVPTILGFVSHEGYWYLNGGEMRVKPEIILGAYEKFPMKFMERLLPHKAYTDYPKLCTEAGQVVKDFYFKNQTVNLDTATNFATMITDQGFMHGHYRTGQALSKANIPCYFFRFSFDGELGMYRRGITKTHKGVSHSDDIKYLFNSVEPKPDPVLDENSNENITRNRMVRMWTNMAKYGNPTPEQNELINYEWKQATADKMEYLEIDTQPEMKTGTFDPAVKMLDQVIDYVDQGMKSTKVRQAVAQ